MSTNSKLSVTSLVLGGLTLVSVSYFVYKYFVGSKATSN